jgi:pyruvate,water dikinase
MGAGPGLIIPLTEAGDFADDLVGGKARALGRLLGAGYRVPAGFCIQVGAYEEFVAATNLTATIGMELGRKPFGSMRWEEIWDAALRIRAAFLSSPLPPSVAEPILAAYAALAPKIAAVRSSAPGEDSAGRSFAGLHESLIGIEDADALLDAVRIVWASLWSDAALLYRKELGLEVAHSRMAVVVQDFVTAPVSGVGFGIDPLNPQQDREVIEAVPGSCEGLVSGAVDPDRWILKRSSGELVTWTPGKRDGTDVQPVLARDDLETLHRTLRSVETFLGCPPDVEWTGRAAELTLLQARPVTSRDDDDDERSWYLTLRPGAAALRDLCRRVTQELIPALRNEGIRFAHEDLQALSAAGLADAIQARHEAHERWKVIYREEFIPFAHGVRHFGMYYNDALSPADPYEFVGLLEHQPMIASERNAALRRLASLLREDQRLFRILSDLSAAGGAPSRKAWQQRTGEIEPTTASNEFLREFEMFLDQHMNMTFKDESLDDRPDLTLNIVLELASVAEPSSAGGTETAGLEKRLLAAVGPDRQDEAVEVLRIARLSWQLRDDDNILMGHLRNQLQHALDLAAERLQAEGRLSGDAKIGADSAQAISGALRMPAGGMVVLPNKPPPLPDTSPLQEGASPRQLIGQPAARGLATGIVRIVEDTQDFGDFQRGEVMVCDAIQPTMTHLVTLASAIIERRGGMLIHGAIIARELGVPCVNGVPAATRLLRNGDFVTVDGHLGIVTVGLPEFDLEHEAARQDERLDQSL